jgi:hypothetical protein
LETTVVELPLLDRQMGHRFGGIEGSGVRKSSARVREEITFGKKLSNLVTQLDSSFKA